jgi:hypothetical protein
MALSESEQVARFGMTLEAAHALRDRALTARIDHKAARRAWQALADELRGDIGNQFAGQPHPESTRLQMLSALADGLTIESAVAIARDYAKRERAA